uniref:30S ribosomal protein S6, chloroplastic n=1 Tax=Sporolithon durum TaxID=48970 RepID=A0A141SD00_9FLOR|nr:ribosomal protein S6 [Sporolithon durum]AMK96168.1 ribosomal protein S6 [Sporolithon durum]
MHLNSYQTIYVLKPDSTESTNLALINMYKALIKKNGGQNIIVQHRGRRHLNYNIKHYYDGIYLQVSYKGNGYLVNKIEKFMRFDDHILRYLTVKQDGCMVI